MTEQAAAPAPAPAFVTPTEGMSETQTAAAAWVDNHRAEMPGTSNAFLLKQYREAALHAFGDAPAPLWLQQREGDAGTKQNAEPAPPAYVDHDMVPGLEGVADKMQPEELAHYRTDCVNQCIHPSVAETMAHLAGEYGIPRAVANDLQTVATTHFKGHESIPVLDDAGQAEMYQAAIEKYGEDVITDLAAQARQVLADKGLLEHFDNLGLTKSSMAFDRRALRALIFWGKASA